MSALAPGEVRWKVVAGKEPLDPAVTSLYDKGVKAVIAHTSSILNVLRPLP